MSHYINYYRRALLTHPTGLKLVLGGTGLGKTSSLAALLRTGDFPPDTKFIYVANRIQLLDEMTAQVADLLSGPIPSTCSDCTKRWALSSLRQ